MFELKHPYAVMNASLAPLAGNLALLNARIDAESLPLLLHVGSAVDSGDVPLLAGANAGHVKVRSRLEHTTAVYIGATVDGRKVIGNLSNFDMSTSPALQAQAVLRGGLPTPLRVAGPPLRWDESPTVNQRVTALDVTRVPRPGPHVVPTTIVTSVKYGYGDFDKTVKGQWVGTTVNGLGSADSNSKTPGLGFHASMEKATIIRSLQDDAIRAWVASPAMQSYIKSRIEVLGRGSLVIELRHASTPLDWVTTVGVSSAVTITRDNLFTSQSSPFVFTAKWARWDDTLERNHRVMACVEVIHPTGLRTKVYAVAGQVPAQKYDGGTGTLLASYCACDEVLSERTVPTAGVPADAPSYFGELTPVDLIVDESQLSLPGFAWVATTEASLLLSPHDEDEFLLVCNEWPVPANLTPAKQRLAQTAGDTYEVTCEQVTHWYGKAESIKRMRAFIEQSDMTNAQKTARLTSLAEVENEADASFGIIAIHPRGGIKPRQDLIELTAMKKLCDSVNPPVNLAAQVYDGDDTWGTIINRIDKVRHAPLRGYAYLVSTDGEDFSAATDATGLAPTTIDAVLASPQLHTIMVGESAVSVVNKLSGATVQARSFLALNDDELGQLWADVSRLRESGAPTSLVSGALIGYLLTTGGGRSSDAVAQIAQAATKIGLSTIMADAGHPLYSARFPWDHHRLDLSGPLYLGIAAEKAERLCSTLWVLGASAIFGVPYTVVTSVSTPAADV